MASMGLTVRQREIYDWMLGYRKENGYPPTQREIASQFKLSGPSAANCHLNAIERKGYIERVPNVSRGVRFTRVVF